MAELVRNGTPNGAIPYYDEPLGEIATTAVNIFGSLIDR
jgi:hypothetical protein